MQLNKMSYTELLELYVELLEQLVQLYNVKAPKNEIDSTRQRQHKVRDELRKRRKGFGPDD